MNTTIEFLDSVKVKYGLVSDYALAKRLGVSQPTVSTYRTKRLKMEDRVCLRVAELLDIYPAIVLACVHSERAKTDAEKSAWKLIYERLGGIAASVLVATILSAHAPAPAQSSDWLNRNNVYYVKSRRRLNPNRFLAILDPFRLST